MNRNTWAAGAAMMACLGLLAPAPQAGEREDYREREEFRQSYETGSNPRLSLSNINGDVEITGWSENTIEVSGVKMASSKERLEALRVDMSKTGDLVEIEVDYDWDDDRWDDGESARVEFTIKVPRGTRLEDFDLVNGDIDMQDLNGEVAVSSVNGSVKGEKLSGDLDLSTVNGDVSLTVTGDLKSIRLHSVNGTVSIYLPKNANAQVSANTIHGDIRSSGDLRADEDRYVGSSLSGTIGKGGGRIDLSTVNGDISIRREGDS